MGVSTGRGASGGGVVAWLFALGVLLMVGSAHAEEIEYSDIDRATVRVLALDAVDTYEFEEEGHRFVLASPVGGHGSGFAVTSDGLVVTAAHVVAGARALAVHVPGVMGPVPARVVHIDETRDVAFLSVRHQFAALAALAPEGSKLKVRSQVFAVGFPLDATRADPQSARGVLSGRLPDGRLQLSISLNPGNSGGPVIDSDDRVFGVVSARSDVKSGAVGLAAAVPLEAFRAVLERAMQKPQSPPQGAEAQKMADLVSLVAHEGETLVRGSVRHDSSEAQKTDRQVRQLIQEMPQSADAALLGAVFFWNRHVALRVHGMTYQAAYNNAYKLVQYAVSLDPNLNAQSKFVQHVLARRSGIEDARFAGGVATSPGAGPGSVVTFKSDSDDVTLHVKLAEGQGQVGQYTVRTTLYGRVCQAPCEEMVPTGNYQAALSKGNGDPVDVEGTLDVAGPVSVTGKYNDRTGVRVAGWIVTIAGGVLGTAIALDPEPRCETSAVSGQSCTDEYPNMALGLGIVGGSLVAGLIMTTRGDTAELKVSPGVAAPSTQQGRVGREGDGLRGLTLSGTF